MIRKTFKKQSKPVMIVATLVVVVLLATNIFLIYNGLNYKSVRLKTQTKISDELVNFETLYDIDDDGEVETTIANFTLYYLGIIDTTDKNVERIWGGAALDYPDISADGSPPTIEDNENYNGFFQVLKIPNEIESVKIFMYGSLKINGSSHSNPYVFYSESIELSKSTYITLNSINVSTTDLSDETTIGDPLLDTEKKDGNFVMDLLFGLL